ncbi:MAG: hypothetical protein ACPLZG_13000 [Thermoproteota archaeon]
MNILKTVEVAFKNSVTICDASYISLAVVKNTYMYTADEKLIEKLKGVYVRYVKRIKDV